MKIVKYPGLVAEMAKRGDKQKELSKLLGITNAGISRRLSGETEWSISEIEKVCKHYNKNYYELFKDEKA